VLKAKLSKTFFSRKGNFEKFNGVLPANVTVQGNISVDGNQTLVIDGLVKGDVQATSYDPAVYGQGDQGVVVSGHVTGNIHGFDHVLINGGTIMGSIEAKKSLALKGKATVEGDITYATLAIETGSIIRGKLTPLQAEPLPEHQGK